MKNAFNTYTQQLDWHTGQTKHEQTHKCFLKAASLGLKPSEAYKTIYQKIVSVGGDINKRDIVEAVTLIEILEGRRSGQ